jgi:hypothetical protein
MSVKLTLSGETADDCTVSMYDAQYDAHLLVVVVLVPVDVEEEEEEEEEEEVRGVARSATCGGRTYPDP